jgi:hypothetical protein
MAAQRDLSMDNFVPNFVWKNFPLLGKELRMGKRTGCTGKEAARPFPCATGLEMREPPKTGPCHRDRGAGTDNSLKVFPFWAMCCNKILFKKIDDLISK